ncbi:haloacid dehalogenase [Lysinibacillus sphaericus OT4b.31]|uniref:Haloacid dehalogenase n=1 Tax=Lysinibacillus sphaericus OT4b.31 TaxID=1285586 RepID=R7ZG48_LYSSH|nr:haloacid dehalogenase [Lysinibacillus sphaericus OT4b.31]
MKKYSVVLFDLDDTLSDPKIGITKSVQCALQNLDIFEMDLHKLELKKYLLSFI